jgi:type II secretory pathway component PulM
MMHGYAVMISLLLLLLLQPLPAQVSEPADLQQEQQLDQELEQLRQQVTQVSAAPTSAYAEIMDL